MSWGSISQIGFASILLSSFLQCFFDGANCVQRLDDLFAEFDTDGNGGIDLKEFLSFVKTLKLEAEARIRDLTDIPIMALKGEKGKRYIPPFTGRFLEVNMCASCTMITILFFVSLKFTVFDGFARKPLFRIMTECDHHYIAEAVEGTGSNAVDMMVATLEMIKIRVGNHSGEF